MTAPHSFGIEKIGQIGISVRNLERSIAFYRDILGLELLFRDKEFALVGCKDIRIQFDELPPDAQVNPRPAFRLDFSVPDIEAAHKALSERGVAFLGRPTKMAVLDKSEIWTAFFVDPDKNFLGLLSEVPIE